MPPGEQTSNPNTECLDQIAQSLQQYRTLNGPVSYAEIARRITTIRINRGIPPAKAEPPRSTVYNAFSIGRSRIDIELVKDIVTALGANEAEQQDWVNRCQNALTQTTKNKRNKASENTSQTRKNTTQTTSEQQPKTPNTTTTTPVNNIKTQTPTTQVKTLHQAHPWLFNILIITGATALNIALHWLLVVPFAFPIYLDMTGTALAAFILGPWRGALVATLTAVIPALSGATPNENILFALVGITGALLWGYGTQNFKMGDTLPRFFALNLIVAISCSIVATTILLLVFNGPYGPVGDTAQTIQNNGFNHIVAAFSANLLTSVFDKTISAFIALSIYATLSHHNITNNSKIGLIKPTTAAHRPNEAAS